MRVRGAAAAAVLATVGPGLAGCTHEGASPERRLVVETTSDGPTDAAEVGPEEAYAAWVAALAAQDAEAACALQAPELTIDLRYEAILVERAELGDPCVEFEALLWEDPAFESEVAGIETTQETEEDALLAVRVGPADDPTDLTVRMVYHRAHWRVFSTEARADSGDEAEADVARWVDAWCDLTSAMTPEEIIALLGPPSGEYTVADGGEPQLWWAQDPYDFRVYLDPVDDSVLELVGDYDALDAADRAALACPELRT